MKKYLLFFMMLCIGRGFVYASEKEVKHVKKVGSVYFAGRCAQEGVESKDFDKAICNVRDKQVQKQENSCSSCFIEAEDLVESIKDILNDDDVKQRVIPKSKKSIGSRVALSESSVEDQDDSVLCCDDGESCFDNAVNCCQCVVNCPAGVGAGTCMLCGVGCPQCLTCALVTYWCNAHCNPCSLGFYKTWGRKCGCKDDLSKPKPQVEVMGDK